MGYSLFFAEQINENRLTLSENETRHAIKVLRHKEGDTLWCIDGKGNLLESRILGTSGKTCELEIISKKEGFGDHPWHLHIAIGIPHHPDRMEWFVEKAVEIGINEITPLITARTEKKHIQISRLNNIALSAVKQSQKSRLPIIHEPIAFNKFIEKSNEEQNFIAHCDLNNTRKWLHHEAQKKIRTLILVGPEGDFSPEEIEKALSKNFVPVQIAFSTLRTETAGITCCNIISLLNT